MFNEVNVDNRLRYPVRGRVIVSTTSRNIEFLENGLKFSHPLYSFDSIQEGYCAVFMLELNGFLTFEKDSFVKISPELAPYERAYFDPTAFAFVKPADPFQPTITGRQAEYPDGDTAYTFRVTAQVGINDTRFFELQHVDGRVTLQKFNETFIPGAEWLGVAKYPGWHNAQI
jgi:hypothetical protein